MKSVLDLFVEKVKIFPNKIAVVENGRQYSYIELYGLVIKLSSKIKKLHNEPKVFILLNSGMNAYATMFASMHAGGYYCPANISNPPEKQKAIIKIFNPNIIISTKKNIESISFGEGVTLRDIEDIQKERTGENISEIYEEHKIAYVIFTSGSTGIPKGVAIKKEGLFNFISFSIKNMGVTNKDRWSQHPNISFDLSVLDIFGALCSGATLFPVTTIQDRISPKQYIIKNKITIWNSVPSVVDFIFKTEWLPSELKTVRIFTFCGELLLKNHCESIFESHPKSFIYNTYGPTEATVSCTSLKISKKNYKKFIWNNTIALGQPIKNMSVFLNESAKNKSEGEILIHGCQLLDRYLDDDKLTNQKLKNIRINGKDILCYLTGDYGVIINGILFFKGRADDQVKIKGHRLELGEINSAFLSAGASSSYSLIFKGELKTFVTLKNISKDEVLNKAKKYLPTYFFPSELIILDSIPRNQNDKIDYKILKELLEQKYEKN